jgi:hypothetical protein
MFGTSMRRCIEDKLRRSMTGFDLQQQQQQQQLVNGIGRNADKTIENTFCVQLQSYAQL